MAPADLIAHIGQCSCDYKKSSRKAKGGLVMVGRVTDSAAVFPALSPVYLSCFECARHRQEGGRTWAKDGGRRRWDTVWTLFSAPRGVSKRNRCRFGEWYQRPEPNNGDVRSTNGTDCEIGIGLWVQRSWTSKRRWTTAKYQRGTVRATATCQRRVTWRGCRSSWHIEGWQNTGSVSLLTC